MATKLPLRRELETKRIGDVTWFRGEVWRGRELLAHANWTTHPHTAMNDGADLLRYCRLHEDELVVLESEPLARAAHTEAHALFA